MNNRIIPVTLSLIDEGERKRLAQIISANSMLRLLDEDAEEMGVLIYEPGPSVDEDMPHIIHALETGQAEDVYLAGPQADPEVLIRGMRSGIREFLQYPVNEDDFRAAIMRTAMRGSLEDNDVEKGKITTVLGAKHGLGATTIAASLAWCLNEADPGSTLLLDLRRPSGEVPYFLDLKHDYDWSHLADDISRLDATYLKSVVTEHESGLHVLPGPAVHEAPDPQVLYLILEQLRHVYAHVIVDTAYPDDQVLPREIEQADIVFVVTQMTLPCLARTSRLLDSIRSQDPDADRRMKLLANRVTKDNAISVDEAADVLGKDIALPVPEDFAASLSAINQGVPIVASHPKSPASKALRRLAKGIGGKKKTAKKRFSLPFAGLFGRKKKGKSENDNLAGAVL